MSQPPTFTPGPWQWFGDSKRGMYLATIGRGRQYVMSFRRQGMNGAQPEFQTRGEMIAASELCVFEVAPHIIGNAAANESRGAVYRRDIVGIDHPDARLLAAAPTLAQALFEITALRAALDQERGKVGKLRAFVARTQDAALHHDDWWLSGWLHRQMIDGGLIDEDGNPTALLSGRGEVKP